MGVLPDGTSVLIVPWAELYPEANAVIVAVPGALLVMLANAYVCPPLIVTEATTDAIALLDDDSVIVTPDSGALAGEPLESCS